MLLAVGGVVSEGEFVNRAQVVNGVTRQPISGEATATVRVLPDPTFDCTDVHRQGPSTTPIARSAG